MTATVFDNDMVAHVWAQGKQSMGRSHNGNFYFEAETLYSYGRHYPVAIRDRKGRIWANADSSTRTTEGKHKNAFRRAVRSSDYMSVPALGDIRPALLVLGGDDSPIYNPGTTPAEKRGHRALYLSQQFSSYLARHWQSLGPDSKAAAIMYKTISGGKWATFWGKMDSKAAQAAKASQIALTRQYEESARVWAATSLQSVRSRMVETAARADDWSRERRLKETTTDLYHAHRAARGAKVKAAVWARLKLARGLVDTLVHMPVRGRIIREHIARVRRLIAGDYSPHTSAIAYAIAWRDSITAILAHGHGIRPALLDSLHAKHREVTETIAAHDRAEAERKQAEQAEQRAEWLAGGNKRAYGLICPAGGPLLRAVDVEMDGCTVKGGNLETSQGAIVPLRHAARVFAFVRQHKEAGTEWKPEGLQRLRVGHFAVDHISATGDFIAGCHSIKWGEVERLARELGLWDCPAESLAALGEDVAA